MPELPEVETIRLGLEKHLPGQILTDIKILSSSLLKYVSLEALQTALIGNRAESVSRRGKFLFLDFADGCRLEFHMRMTGRLVFGPGKNLSQNESHLRGVFTFSQGMLFFYDQRKFGTLRLRQAGEEPSLGVEPLSNEFTPEYLRGIFRVRRAPIKALLLNQNLIAGLGNIYTDEALYAAGIYPGRPGGELSGQEIERLHAAIVEVLKKAITARGTTFRDYRDSQGDKGGFQNMLAVYRLQGTQCCRCGSEIQKTRIAGRGTHYCPCCQPARTDK